MATMLSSKIQLRRDLYTNWSKVNPVLGAGEPGVCMPGTEADDVKHAFELRIGDGVTKFLELPAIGTVGGGGSTDVLVDSKSIIKNAAGEIALNKFSDAAVGYVPTKGENGDLVWVPLPAEGGEVDLTEIISKVDANTQKITELEGKIAEINTKLIEDYYTKTEIDSKLSSAYTPGETFENVSQLPSPPTEADVGVVHPIINPGTTTEDFINPGQPIDGGDQVVAVKQPDGTIKYDVLPGGVMDISNLQEQVEKNTLDIATNKNNIATNTQSVDNVRTNLLNNYYTKPEIDSKISSIYHPAPGVENVTDLPTPPTAEPGTVIPVEKPGTATEDFVNPGEEIPAGSTIVVVETPEGEKKYDVLPPAEVPDLSAYATKTDLTEGLATKVSSITAGGTTVLTKVDGTVDIPVALATNLGLVRSGSESDENAVVVGSDGKMKIVNVTLGNIVQGADDDVTINGGSAAG